VYDKDGDQLAGAFTYWQNGSSTKATVDSAAVSSGKTAEAEIPDTFTNGLTNGTEVDWDVYAYNGAPSGDDNKSGTSQQCHFYVFPTAPAAPAITGGPGTTEPTPGAAETFNLSAAAESGATPVAFVWGLDKQPADSSPASSQVIKLSPGVTTASVPITVPSGGPHSFYAYTEYSTGPVSQLGTSEWDASNDPVVSCASFADALSNAGCTGASSTAANQMISNGDPGCASGTTDTSGKGNGDGSGDSLSACALEAAGWEPGGTVTIDGATFTLPGFGTSTSGPDNLLAANQTIGMPANSQGTSLVILATGTNANVPAGGDALSNTSVAVPSVPTIGGGNVVGPCDSYAAGAQQTANNSAACEEPAGVITYEPSSGVPEQNYSLTVPDWASGPAAGAAAVTFSDRATSSGTQAVSSRIYAFSIPISPAVPVASVTLPDLGAVVKAATGIAWPSVHILGIAVANTSTATPGNTTTGAAGPWTGGWSSPPEGALAPPAAVGSAYKNQTIRLVTQVTAGGSTLRLRLSDALAAAGVPALGIGAVTVAPTSSGAAVSASPTAVTFGGSSSVTIPAGTDVYSDPVGLAVTAEEDVTVSIYLSGTYASLPEETYCGACTEYVSAVSTGNNTANANGAPFSGTSTATGEFGSILTGVDVDTGNDLPTAVVLGDGLINGNSTGKPVQGALRVSDDLAADLALQTGPATFGVVSAGIEANQVLTDSTTAYGGPSALSRLARDILAEPNVGTVIIGEGEEDLLNGATEQELENGLGLLAGELGAWGITVVYTTMTPCSGYSTCTTAVDTTRTTVNTELAGEGASPQQGCAAPPGFSCADQASVYTADFSTAVGNSASPQQLQSAYSAGDDVNLTDAGYTAEANTIPVIVGEPVPLQAAAPPPDV
jgi:hypothetical protein